MKYKLCAAEGEFQKVFLEPVGMFWSIEKMSKFKVCYNVMTHKQTQCQAVSIAKRKTLWLTEMFSFRAGRLAYCSCPTIWGSMSSAERRKRASRLLSYNENRKRKTFPTRHFDLTADFWLRPLSAKQEINVMFEKKKKSFWSHIFKQNFIRHWQTRNEQKTINSWFFFFYLSNIIEYFLPPFWTRTQT